MTSSDEFRVPGSYMAKVALVYATLYFLYTFGRAYRGHLPLAEALVLAVVLALLLSALLLLRYRRARVIARDDRLVVFLTKIQSSQIHLSLVRDVKPLLLGGFAFTYEGERCKIGLPFNRAKETLIEYVAARLGRRPAAAGSPGDCFRPGAAKAVAWGVGTFLPFALLALMVFGVLFKRSTPAVALVWSGVTLALGLLFGSLAWSATGRRKIVVAPDRFTAFIPPFPPATVFFREITGIDRNLMGVGQVHYAGGEIFYIAGRFARGGEEFIDCLKRKVEQRP